MGRTMSTGRLGIVAARDRRTARLPAFLVTLRPLRVLFVLRTLHVLSALCALCALCACDDPPEPQPAPRGDVLLVVLDTTRADHLSSYGYPRETTPQLDRLAAEGERYDDAWAHAPWTLPTMASILTGLPPHVHGAGRGPEGVYGILPDVKTLAEQMAAAGYRTGALINVVWCSPALSSLDRGFELYDYHETDATNLGHRDARRTTDAALGWLEQLGDDPFFLTVHYFDPHLTYDPPAPFDTMFEEGQGPRLRSGFGSAEEMFRVRDGRIRLDDAQRRSLVARYDGELRFVDTQFGRLREALERSGRWERTLVVVVADHGEEFWDHGGFEHGHTHHRELLQVPLIVRQPGGPAGVVRSGRVRQIDIAPTVLRFAGIPAGDQLPGRVLGEQGSRYAVAEGTLWAGDLVSLRDGRGSWFLHRDLGQAWFYAADDPAEQRALPADDPAAADVLELLGAIPARPVGPDEPRRLSEEQLERLRSLGYVR